MKKTKILFGLMLSLSINVNAQLWDVDVSGNAKTTTLNDCSLGGMLYVKGSRIDLTSGTGDSYKAIIGGSHYGGMGMYSHYGVYDGSAIEMFSDNAYSWHRKGRINYYSWGDPTDPTTDYHGHIFYNYNHNHLNNELNAWMSITHDGHVIIGENLINGSSYLSPISSNYNLSVEGNVNIRGGWLDMAMTGDPKFRGITGSSSKWGLGIMANTGSKDGSGINLYGPNSDRPGAIYYGSYGPSDSRAIQHMFLNYDPNNNFTALMGIQGNGAVLIGQELIWPTGSVPPTPAGYNLYVSKGILTEKLKVANSTDGANWSDFVFNSDYELKSLCDVESYIQSNKHLPEIPSAREVARDGIDVAGMDAKLLQKIEELTLYVIQQQKEINELKNQVRK